MTLASKPLKLSLLSPEPTMSRNYQNHPERYPDAAQNDPHVVYIKPGFEPNADWVAMMEDFEKLVQDLHPED